MNEPGLMLSINVAVKVLLFAIVLIFVFRGKCYRCPSCGKKIKPYTKAKDSMRFGYLRCPSCGCQFPADE